MAKRILVIEQEHSTDLPVYAEAIAREAPEVEIVLAANEAEAQAHCSGATAIIAKAHSISAAVIAAIPQLEWIQALTTGTDHLATVNLPGRVVITSARGVHGPQMSELTFMFMLAFTRDVHEVLYNQAAATWLRRPQRLLLGKTAVLVGVGAISEALAVRCKAFGMRTIGVSSAPRVVAGFDEIVARQQLHEAAGKADFLIVLAPLTAETHHMIDAGVLAAMQPHAVLINLARGKLCDEDALIAALRRKQISGAGLDVFAVEPLPATSPLWRMENVIITPHIGGMSDSYVQQTVPLVVENLRHYRTGDFARMRNIVDRSSAEA